MDTWLLSLMTVALVSMRQLVLCKCNHSRNMNLCGCKPKKKLGPLIKEESHSSARDNISFRPLFPFVNPPLPIWGMSFRMSLIPWEGGPWKLVLFPATWKECLSLHRTCFFYLSRQRLQVYVRGDTLQKFTFSCSQKSINKDILEACILSGNVVCILETSYSEM